MAKGQIAARRGAVWQSVVIRALVLAFVWWVLTEGAGAVAFAMVLVPLALAASLRLLPAYAYGLRLRGVLQFVPFFFWESLRGGVDVAWRAINPRLPLAPSLVEIPLRLQGERERVLLASVVCLLPGTVCAELKADRVRLHVLDTRLPVESTVRRLESRIVAIFDRSPSAAGG